MFYQSFKSLLDFNCPNCNSKQFSIINRNGDSYVKLQSNQDGYYIIFPSSFNSGPIIEGFNTQTIYFSTGLITVDWKIGSRSPPISLVLDCFSCQSYSRTYVWHNQYQDKEENQMVDTYKATNIHIDQETIIPVEGYKIVSSDVNNITKLIFNNKLLIRLDQHYLPFKSQENIQALFVQLKTLTFYN